VTRATLYAYVSRGRLHSERTAGGSRFRRAEVEAWRARGDLRRRPEEAARQGLHWGAPVLESALTLIEDGRLYYRGRDALELARSSSLERVAALLWTGSPEHAPALFGRVGPRRSEHAPRREAARLGALGPVERCQALLPLAGAADAGACDLRPQAVAEAGARILSCLFGAVSGRWEGPSLAGRLHAAWCPGRRAAARAIEGALVLCADHELNVSAFTARCVASAAASPYDVVAAGLCALKGGRHGGYTRRVEALFHESGRPERAREALGERLRRGEGLPGFGHPLYPQGDPRAALLLDLAREAAPRAPAIELAEALRAAALTLVGDAPTLDFGLVALSRALRLPADAPLALFALGRSVGWIGQALEQYQAERLIRPRARYVGPRPEASA
jgi:citrate synthase